MRKIRLGHSGLFARIDDEDYERVSAFKWYALKVRGGYFARANITVAPKEQVTVYMHRLIMHAPADKEVSHKDRDGLNNQRSNLRLGTRRQVAASSYKRPSPTGFRGVLPTKNGQRFFAKIIDRGKFNYLGTFDTPEKAARAYDREARARFGEFAVLNFPR